MATKRSALVGLAMAAAMVSAGVLGAAAQDDLTPEAGVTTTAAQTAEPRDEGFDDWGLLGLLGLAGLVGLRRQPARTVVAERHDGTPTRRP